MDNGASSYRRFLDGDDEGIVEIVREYKDGLILYLNRYVQNIHIAQDLTEDTFFRLLTAKPRFRGNCSFKTWLYAIGHHIAVDHIRKNAVAQQVCLEELRQVLQDQSDLERDYLRAQQRQQLYAALQNIPSDYAEALYLVYLEGFSNREAGKILRKTDRQMRNLLYRGKLSLKSELEKEGFAYEEL